MTDITIEVRGLTRYYGDLVAVDHIAFQIGQGEIFGLLGPNGAGKTTSIRMLTGLLQPSAGTAAVMGLNVWQQACRAKKCMGVVPEISNLYDELTALDNLIFMGQLYGVPRKERPLRAEEMLALFNLTEKRHVPFRALSTGMKRRLTIAAALVHRPPVVFLDEPTSGLDVVNARILRQTILSLREHGTTVLLTTHNIEEAGWLCDRIAIMVQGRIIAVDTPQGLRNRVQEEATIDLELNTPLPGAEDALKEVPGVLGVSPDPGGGLRLQVADIAETLPRVVAQLEGAGGQIVSLNTNRIALEEAFVQITGLSKEIMLAEKGGKG